MEGARTGIVVVMLALALGGCGIGVPLEKSRIEKELPQTTATIVVGQSDRAAVRRMLGEPLAASDYWQFDLFRVSESNSLLLILPFPAYSKEDVTAYVLVRYDVRQTVVAYDTGITSSPSMMSSNPTWGAKVSAADTSFIFEWEPKAGSVYVDAPRRDQFLAEHGARDRCAVLAGWISGGDRIRRLEVDGRSTLAFPGLRLLMLEAGSHRLEIPPGTWDTLRASAEFSCAAGQVSYAAFEFWPVNDLVDGRPRMHLRVPLEGSISVLQEMPEQFAEQPLLIWRDGVWLVPQEP